MQRQVFIFKDQPKETQDITLSSSFELSLLLRISLINNSVSPALHLLDVTTHLSLLQKGYSSQRVETELQLDRLQIDNQTSPLTYFSRRNHLIETCFLYIKNFTFQWQYGLVFTVSALFCRTASGITLHQEDLTQLRLL